LLALLNATTLPAAFGSHHCAQASIIARGRPAESVPAQFAVDDLHQTTSKLLDGVFVHLKKDNPSRVAFQER
jgi:hypothetical protein